MRTTPKYNGPVVHFRAMPNLTIDSINRMTPGAFLAAFGGVFEHSPWIAECAWLQRPFSDVSHLHHAMVEVVQTAAPDEQLALLRAHPELAGKEARAGTLTAASTGEQKAAGLNALTRAELDRIADLNRRHRERFGFPFIIAARLNSKDQILAEFARRLELSADAERTACLEQVYLITRLRLDDAVQ